MSILSRQNFGMSRLSRPKLGMSRLWRPKIWRMTKMCTFKTFATEVEKARLCRPKRRRCDQDYIDGYDAQYYGYLLSEVRITVTGISKA